MKKIALITGVLMMTILWGQSVISYTTFGEPQTGSQYRDTGDKTVDHALVNNDGQSWVMYAPASGASEMGFTAYYYNTLNDVGLTEGDYFGVTNYIPTGVTAYPDGDTGYQLSDVDGKVEVTFDAVNLGSATAPYFSMYYLVNEDGWETADFIKIWLVNDGTEEVLFNTEGSDIDDLGVEGAWRIASADLTGVTQSVLHVALQSNAGYEGLYIDNIRFTDGETNVAPIANAGADQIVIVNSAVTLDGSGSLDQDGTVASYEWVQLSGTSVTLSSTSTASVTFTAPAAPATLSFQLTVTDDKDATDKDTVAVTVANPVESSVFISEYIEGTSNNKYLEIYNGGDEMVDLNAEGYSLARVNSGDGVFTYAVLTDWGSIGQIEPGDVIVLAAENHVIYTMPDTVLVYNSPVHFNGNDAVALFKDGVMLDVVGEPTNTENIIIDMGLRRNSSVKSGNTTFTLSEWTQLAIDDVSGLGNHGGAGAPAMSAMTVSPDFLMDNTEITLSIDIVPNEGQTIESANIYYGKDGSQLNTSEMWLDQNNTWMGIVDAQDGNISFEYKFVAVDSDGNQFPSPVYSKLIASSTPTDISEIQANASAYMDRIFTVRGVITIGSGVIQTGKSSAYIQDNSGRGLNLFDYTEYADVIKAYDMTVVGYVDVYYTTVELTGFDYKINATGQALPAAAQVSIAQANSSQWEGTRIEFEGKVAERYDLTTNNGSRFYISEGTDTTCVMIWYTTGINMDDLTIGSHARFTGVGSQYSNTYQLLVGYQSDMQTQTGVEDNIQPNQFALNPAYPNPFNPETSISFSIPENQTVVATIYNVTGQQIDQLEQDFTAGTHKIVWNAANHSTGVYFIEVRAGSHRAMQKVLLLK